jgi:hypothetical protein
MTCFSASRLRPNLPIEGTPRSGLHLNFMVAQSRHTLVNTRRTLAYVQDRGTVGTKPAVG